MDNNISIILKICDACNLKCKHCYESAHSLQGYYNINNIMPLAYLEKIFSLAQSEYHYVKYVWFGGEPLLCGLEYFQKAIFLQKKHNHGNVIENHIQTNGTLLSKNFVDFFKKEAFAISISYDGQYNGQLRQKTKATLQGISNCKSAHVSCGILSTIHSGNYNHQIEMYQHIKHIGCPMKFNPIFPSGAAIKNTCYLLNVEAYVNETIKFFRYWCEDETAVPVSPFVQYLKLFLGFPGRNCTYGACLYKWIDVDPDGSIFPCSRFAGSEYVIGNIQNINSVETLFSSKEYKSIVFRAVQRRLLCRKECSLYSFCNGGCNSAAAMECELSRHDFQLCTITKLMFPKMIAEIELLKKRFDIKNPVVRNMIDRAAS